MQENLFTDAKKLNTGRVIDAAPSRSSQQSEPPAQPRKNPDATLIDEFLRKGGRVRKMPDGKRPKMEKAWRGGNWI